MNEIIHADALDALRDMPEASVDLICTDPPYGISFMQKSWDALPSVDIWRECLRVLKPGAFAFIMCTPRQDSLYRMIQRLEEAGFVIGFSSIYWTFASGFPKAQNISRAIDKQECRKQLTERLGRKPTKDEMAEAWKGFREVVEKRITGKGRNEEGWQGGQVEINETAPATPQAQALDGAYGGFQPKPAVEVILVVMKPLDQKTFTAQALKNGKGITWLDDAKIPFSSGIDLAAAAAAARQHQQQRCNEEKHETVSLIINDSRVGKDPDAEYEKYMQSQGRFPANLLVSDNALDTGEDTISKGGNQANRNPDSSMFLDGKPFESTGLGYSGSFSRFFSLDAWFNHRFGERKKELPKAVQRTFPFLVCPKPSKAEKNKGLEGMPELSKRPSGVAYNEHSSVHRDIKKGNVHPTCKSIALMFWLITIGSRPGDVVLDPFAGSGTTCIAAKILDRKWIGIERELEYVEIGRKRIKAWQSQNPLFHSQDGQG